MAQGSVTERGTHSELLVAPGSRYRQMVETLEAKGSKKEGRAAGAASQAPSKKQPLNSAALGRVTVDEKKREGAVTWSTLRFYLKCLGSWPLVCYVYIVSWSYNVGEVAPDYYLALWREGFSLAGEETVRERFLTWAAVG